MSNKLDSGVENAISATRYIIDRTPFSEIEKDALAALGVNEAIGALVAAFNTAHAEDRLTRGDVAAMLGWSPSAVTRILNGRSENFTVKSLALLMRAMGHRFTIEGEPTWTIRDSRNGTIKDEMSSTHAPSTVAKTMRFSNFADNAAAPEQDVRTTNRIVRELAFEAVE